jgi:hypothetical protein
MTNQVGHEIGISLGTRSTGLAVMHLGSLKNYKVIVFKNRWSKQKLMSILKRLGSLITIPGCTVAVKVPPAVYQSKSLQDLTAALAKHFKDHNIRYMLLTIDDLKNHCFPNLKANKKELIDWITNKYPELLFKYQLEKKNRHAYYGKLFEATIAAEIISSKNVR